VDAERLAQLNADSAACISRWRITVAHSEELGRFLVSTTGVPAGETVMVLPPNLIQSFEDVRDYNTVIQVRAHGCAGVARGVWWRRSAPQLTPALVARQQVFNSELLSERLYSASLTADDLDNFLSHRRARLRTPALHAHPAWRRSARNSAY
jgi:hypothetical protein